MAVRLVKFCGNGPGPWLRLQQTYDLWHAERLLADALKRIPTHRLAASVVRPTAPLAIPYSRF